MSFRIDPRYRWLSQGDEPGVMAVSTATIIPLLAGHPNCVWAMRHLPAKHNGGWTFPGGRIDPLDLDGGITMPAASERCAVRELVEECGGKGGDAIKVVGRPRLVILATDPARDVRNVKLSKITYGRCPADSADTPISAVYGYPDFVYAIEIEGEPQPNDGEAAGFDLCDINNLSSGPMRLSAGHDVIAHVYSRICAGAQSRVSIRDFAAYRRQHIS